MDHQLGMQEFSEATHVKLHPDFGYATPALQDYL